MADGYRMSLLFVWLNSPELAIERVEARVAAGGHDIPEATIRRRYCSGLRNFFNLYQSLASAWGVYDNSEPGAPVLIARGKGADEQVILQVDRWTRFCEAAQ